MSAEPLRDPVHIADALEQQIAEADGEIAALEACLAEQREYRAELERRRDELRSRPGATALTGAHVRDAMTRLGGFTFGELLAELGRPAPEVRKFFKPLLLSGAVREDGHVSRAPFYRYEKPEGDSSPRPRHTPPEKATAPAGSERRATGEPVRVAAMEKLTRRGRSIPGQSHKHRQRDARYEAMQRAQEAAAEAQKAKAQKDPKWKKRK